MLIPNFFKHLPARKQWRQRGTWRVEVHAVFPMKETLVVAETFESTHLYAYIRARLLAWKKDLATNGETYGIGWSLIPVTAADPHLNLKPEGE